MKLLVHYTLLLAITFALETSVYLLLLRRQYPVRRLVLAAFIINLLTNPAANFVYLRWGVSIPLIELIIILVEAGLLAAVLRCPGGRALLTSLAANLSSWLLGAPIYALVMGVIGRMVT